MRSYHVIAIAVLLAVGFAIMISIPSVRAQLHPVNSGRCKYANKADLICQSCKRPPQFGGIFHHWASVAGARFRWQPFTRPPRRHPRPCYTARRRWGSEVQRLQTRAAMLEAKQAVELEPAVILPPGYYPATELRHGLETMDGDVTWAVEPQYKIEFSAKELAKIGVKGAASHIFVKYDVTMRVRSGELIVA